MLRHIPAEVLGAMLPTIVQLTNPEVLVARRIGDGNASAGIAAALRACPTGFDAPEYYGPGANSRQRNIKLPDDMCARARALGGGKIAPGVRVALAHAHEHKLDTPLERLAQDLELIDGDDDVAVRHNEAVRVLRARGELRQCL